MQDKRRNQIKPSAPGSHHLRDRMQPDLYRFAVVPKAHAKCLTLGKKRHERSIRLTEIAQAIPLSTRIVILTAELDCVVFGRGTGV